MGLFDLFKRRSTQGAPGQAASADKPTTEADPSVQAIPQGAISHSPTPSAISRALNRTRAFFSAAFTSDPSSLVDEAYWTMLHDALLLADTGSELAQATIEQCRRDMADRGLVKRSDAVETCVAALARLLTDVGTAPQLPPDRLAVILAVGVNGTGKTTFCAKLAKRLSDSGRNVMLAAADTFRAAAVEQLKVWASRIGVELVAGQTNADPASVVFDAVSAAKARGTEVLIIDTAGRLQTKQNLMAELTKTARTVEKALAGTDASIAHILVIDATVGQNAISQAEIFNDCCRLDGIAVNKLDGTAKGGAIIAVVRRLRIPVLYLGIGEGVDDLIEFEALPFSRALLGQTDDSKALPL